MYCIPGVLYEAASAHVGVSFEADVWPSLNARHIVPVKAGCSSFRLHLCDVLEQTVTESSNYWNNINNENAMISLLSAECKPLHGIVVFICLLPIKIRLR